jgi:hypothetical protein
LNDGYETQGKLRTGVAGFGTRRKPENAGKFVVFVVAPRYYEQLISVRHLGVIWGGLFGGTMLAGAFR